MMAEPVSHQTPIRTLRLDDAQIEELLDRMDEESPAQPTTQGGAAFRYRQRSIIVHIQRPGDPGPMPYVVVPRHITSNSLTFLFGGFVHHGASCGAQLITTHGTWNIVPGVVSDCRHVENQIHEITTRLEQVIDCTLYCADALRAHVLLAEDDPMAAKAVQYFLSKLNADVVHVENGRKAVDQALAESYDLILMDLDMPVLGGLEAVAELRGKGYSGTIIACTAMTQEEDKMRCLESGCDAYLDKPLSIKKLSKAMEMLRQEPMFSNFHDDPRMTDLLVGFVGELPDMIRNLEESITKGEREAAVKLIRTLKGQGASYGFETITEEAETVEQALSNGGELDAIYPEIQKLIRLCLQAQAPKVSTP